jgi:hypothetical protein
MNASNSGGAAGVTYCMTCYRQVVGGSLRRVLPLFRHRVIGAVVVPFLLSRLALALVGWLSQDLIIQSKFIPNESGSLYSPHRLLDIWGRWDSGWYMSIVTGGYRVSEDLTTVQSNVAFFPLYPYLVRLALLPIPAQLRTPGVILFVGIVISNACFTSCCSLATARQRPGAPCST